MWASLCRTWPGAVVLRQIAQRAEPAVAVDRHQCDAAVFVVGHQQPAAGRVGTQVAWLAATRLLPTQPVQRPAGRVDAKRYDLAAVQAVAFADCEQESLARIEGNKRRILFLERVQVPQGPRGRVVLKEFDAASVTGAGVATDVHKVGHGS